MAESSKKGFFVDVNGIPHAPVTMQDMSCLLTTYLMAEAFAILDLTMTDEQQLVNAKQRIKQLLWETHGTLRHWMIANSHAEEKPMLFPYSDNQTIG